MEAFIRDILISLCSTLAYEQLVAAFSFLAPKYSSTEKRNSVRFDSEAFKNRELLAKSLSKELYPRCIEALQSRSVNSHDIDIAYALTEVYDYIGDGTKSAILSEKILEALKISKPATIEHYIRYLIGCSYSLTIAKTDDETKCHYLQKACENLEIAKEQLESSDIDLYMGKLSQLELWGLYYSDHAAYLVNSGKQSRSKSQRNNFYKMALAEYKLSKEKREEAYSTVRRLYKWEDGSGNDDCWLNDSNRLNRLKSEIIKTDSNMASMAYRMGNYLKAIEAHEQVLQQWIGIGDQANIHLTKVYIIGSSIELARIDESQVTANLAKHVRTYLNDCCGYYESSKDQERLKDVLKKQEDWNCFRFD